MQTFNKTEMPNYDVVADATLFGCVSGIDVNNSTTFSQSFIFYEALELPESPLVHPLVVFCSSSDVPQIFHHNSASIGNAINNSPAYPMVSCRHKLSPSARDFSQMSLGRFCAFSLQAANQFIILDSKGFDFLPEELVVRSDSEVVYSNIDAKNSILDIRAFDINIFGERKQKKTPSSFINSQQAFSNVPSEVLFKTIRNREWNFNSTFDCSQTQDVVFERGRTWKVVSHANFIDDWFAFCSFNHSTTLLDTSGGKLGLQSERTQLSVNKRVQFDVVSNSSFPSSIDTEFQTFPINGESFNYFGSGFDSDFGCSSDVHFKSIEIQRVFKPYPRKCPVSSSTISKTFGGDSQFFP